jgi:drug/metabolite transporter (DMT)-like permease
MTQPIELSRQPTKIRLGLILSMGILAVSLAAVLIRLAIAAAGGGGVSFSLFLSAARLIIASTFLLPVWQGLHLSQQRPAALFLSGAAGLCLAMHFAAWITSLSFTSIAASATLVTTNPIWVALISWIWFGDKPTRITALGIGVALGGGFLIASSDLQTGIGNHPLLGNLLAILGAILASLYILLGREAQKQGMGIGGYVAIAYSTGALFLLPLPFLAGGGYLGYPLAVYGYTALMAIASQVIGHTSINWSVKWISPTLVALALLFEPVGASVLGYFVFKEIPGMAVLAGAALVLVGMAIAIAGDRKPSVAQ